MRKIYFISGPCGSGKSTFTDEFSRHLVRQEHKTVYVIHGDNFHQGFIEPEDKGYFFVGGEAHNRVLWEDILRFNWDCILMTAEKALAQGMDVVIDYVIETELPRVRALAEKKDGLVLVAVEVVADMELKLIPNALRKTI